MDLEWKKEVWPEIWISAIKVVKQTQTDGLSWLGTVMESHIGIFIDNFSTISSLNFTIFGCFGHLICLMFCLSLTESASFSLNSSQKTSCPFQFYIIDDIRTVLCPQQMTLNLLTRLRLSKRVAFRGYSSQGPSQIVSKLICSPLCPHRVTYL